MVFFALFPVRKKCEGWSAVDCQSTREVELVHADGDVDYWVGPARLWQRFYDHEYRRYFWSLAGSDHSQWKGTMGGLSRGVARQRLHVHAFPVVPVAVFRAWRLVLGLTVVLVLCLRCW